MSSVVQTVILNTVIKTPRDKTTAGEMQEQTAKTKGSVLFQRKIGHGYKNK